MAISTSCSSNFLRGSCKQVSTVKRATLDAVTDLLALEGAPVLDVGDGERVGSLGVRHVDVIKMLLQWRVSEMEE